MVKMGFAYTDSSLSFKVVTYRMGGCTHHSRELGGGWIPCLWSAVDPIPDFPNNTRKENITTVPPQGSGLIKRIKYLQPREERQDILGLIQRLEHYTTLYPPLRPLRLNSTGLVNQLTRSPHPRKSDSPKDNGKEMGDPSQKPHPHYGC